MDAAKNFAKGTVDGFYDDEVTSIDLIAGDGARFPTPPFNAVWWNSTDFPDPSDDPSVEIVRVTAIATDTLTIARGHEGTGSEGVAGFTHDVEGKTYKLIAPLTAKVINDEVVPAQRVDDDWVLDLPSDYDISVAGTITIDCAGTALRLAANAVGVVLDMSGGMAALGDVDENNSGVAIIADDNLGQASVRGKFGTNQNVSASGPVGTVVAKLPIYNLAGTLVGYIPIYNSIT